MKKKIIIVGIAASIAYIGLMVTVITAATRVKAPVVITTPPVKTLSDQQRVWLNALRWCESQGVDGSINPKDRDNTPSWGRYQFKPGTFEWYKKLYGIQGELMDGQAQEKIVEQMILKGGIKWSQEFPECTRKLGYPPKEKQKGLTSNNKGI